MFCKYLCSLMSLIFLAGCAHLSVVHLDKKQWTRGQTETLTTRYWTFKYTTQTENNRLIISGVAQPITANIPDWATWIQDLWIQAYLSDDQNKVLAKDLRLYLPTELDPEQGVPFEFHLFPETLGASGPLFISFGYRMELTPDRAVQPVPGQQPQIFFASQGALFQ